MIKKSRLALIIVCAVAGLGLISLWLAGAALSGPVNQAVGPPPSDLHARSVRFLSESGSTVSGWLVPGQAGRGIVVPMHGVRSDRASMIGRARFLSAAGYTVLLFDFQAHGESPGEHITFGYLESRDARAAVRFAREQSPGDGRSRRPGMTWV